MKKVTIFISLLATVLFLASAVFAQSRGQGAGRPAGAGAPTTPGIQGNRPTNPGQSTDHRPANPGKPESTGQSAGHPADPKDAQGFKNYGQYMAATHVAENLMIDFELLRKAMVDDKLSLGKAIQNLRPDLSSQTIEVEVKKAEAEAKKEEAEAKKGKPTD